MQRVVAASSEPGTDALVSELTDRLVELAEHTGVPRPSRPEVSEAAAEGQAVARRILAGDSSYDLVMRSNLKDIRRELRRVRVYLARLEPKPIRARRQIRVRSRARRVTRSARSRSPGRSTSGDPGESDLEAPGSASACLHCGVTV